MWCLMSYLNHTLPAPSQLLQPELGHLAMYTSTEAGLCVHCTQCALSLSPAAIVPVTPVPRVPGLLHRMFTVLMG
jgi:hypothetical protein